MNVGTKVSWPRPGLPDGEGTITEVKDRGDHNFYMVRDQHGNIHAFHEHLHPLKAI